MNSYTPEINLNSALVVISCLVSHHFSNDIYEYAQERNLISARIEASAFAIFQLAISMKRHTLASHWCGATIAGEWITQSSKYLQKA